METLAHLLDSFEWTPQLFAEVYNEAQSNPELIKGVNSALIFEGCDLEDLEEALGTLQANIWEAME